MKNERSARVTSPADPPGRAEPPLSLYPSHYAPPPVPPASLTPFAMDELDDNADTARSVRRPYHHPTIRTGFAILVTGAFIGGMFGLAQRIQQKYAPETGISPASALQAGPQTPADSTTTSAERESVPIASSEPSEVPLGVVIPAPTPAPLVLVTPPRASKPGAKRVAGPHGKPSSPTRSLAATKREARPIEPRSSTVKTPAEASPHPPDADSERLLKAAVGATENTL